MDFEIGLPSCILDWMRLKASTIKRIRDIVGAFNILLKGVREKKPHQKFGNLDISESGQRLPQAAASAVADRVIQEQAENERFCEGFVNLSSFPFRITQQ